MSEFDFQDGYRKGYRAGYLDALRLYAHWKDGTQYVGTCGRTLASAIEELDAEFRMLEKIEHTAGATA